MDEQQVANVDEKVTKSLARWMVIVFGWIIVAMSLIVILGWYLHEPSLIQLSASFAPMQYNTAFCFLLAGVSILLLNKYPRISLILSILLFAIASVSLLQYIFNFNLGIDELAMKAYVMTRTSHAGRMAPNTAICFILSSIVLFLFSQYKRNKKFNLIALLIISLSGALSFIALFGYLTGLEVAYGWGSLTGMALHTSIGLLLVAVALILYYICFPAEFITRNTNIYSYGVLVIGIFLSILFWQALKTDNNQKLRGAITKEHVLITNSIEKVVEQKVDALERLFSRSETGAYHQYKDLRSDVGYYFSHMKSLEVVSLKSNFNEKAMMFHRDNISNLRASALMSKCLDVLNSSNEVVVAFPGYFCVTDINRLSIGILNVEKTLTSIQSNFKQLGYGIEIMQGSNKIYLSMNVSGKNLKGDYSSTKEILDINGIKFEVIYLPTNLAYKEFHNYIPVLILMFGLVITLMLFYVVRLWGDRVKKNDALLASVKEQKELQKNLVRIIEISGEAILIINRTTQVVYCNKEARRLWRAGGPDMYGRPVRNFVDSQLLGQIDDIITKHFEEGFHLERLLRGEIKNAQNQWIPVEVGLNTVRYNQRLCIEVKLNDISDRLRYEKELKEQAKSIQLIYDSIIAITDNDDLNKAYQMILGIMCESLNWPVGHVYLYDKVKHAMIPSNLWYTENYVNTEEFIEETKATTFKQGEGVPGRVQILRRPIWIENLNKDKKFLRKKNCQKHQLKAVIAVPIIVHEEVYAVLEFFNTHELEKDDKLLQTLQLIGEQVGRVIERKQAQQELEKAETRNRLLLDFAGEGIYGLNLEGEATFVNKSALRTLGYEKSELIGKKMHEIIHYQHADGSEYLLNECPIHSVLTSGIQKQVEHDVLWKKDGKPIYVDYISTPIYVNEMITGAVILFSDITEKVHLQRQRLEQEEFYQGLINAVQNYAIIALDPEGNIVSWNSGAEQIKGYCKEEVLGKSFKIFYPPETVNTLPDELLEKAAKDGSVKNIGFRVRKDGSLFWADVVITALYGENGEVRGYLKVTRDLTESKNAEQALLKYSDDLKKSNNELNDFAYIASHDLKEPLRGISNFAGFLMEDYRDKLDDTGKEYLTTLTRLCERLENFIDALLNYSRVGRVDLALEKVNAESLIDEKIEMLQHFITEKHAEVNIMNQMPTLMCDPTRLGEVFYNLISNAIKYNDNEYKIVNISCSNEPDYYLFCVADNGIGIDEQHYEKIFKIFQRLHPKEKYGGGTGAGMTIVKKIVERHGGRIWLESEVGKGTKFYFTVSKNLCEKKVEGEKHG